jgi:hypothetical protein
MLDAMEKGEKRVFVTQIVTMICMAWHVYIYIYMYVSYTYDMHIWYVHMCVCKFRCACLLKCRELSMRYSRRGRKGGGGGSDTLVV